MEVFSLPLQLRWSDLDPNFHLRHSVYYDWAALCRMEYLQNHGLTPALMKKLNFGPIIFREEGIFRKEIRYGDSLHITMRLAKSRRDYSRWTIVHDIIKQQDTVCATVTIDGAWLNTVERKLFIPPKEVVEVFQQIPVGEGIEWID